MKTKDIGGGFHAPLQDQASFTAFTQTNDTSAILDDLAFNKAFHDTSVQETSTQDMALRSSTIEDTSNDASSQRTKRHLDPSMNPVLTLSNLQPAQQYDVDIFTVVKGSPKQSFNKEKQVIHEKGDPLKLKVFTLPGPVHTIEIHDVTYNQAIISWERPLSNYATNSAFRRYDVEIERKAKDGSYGDLQKYETTARLFTVTDLPVETDLRIRVKAVTIHGDSSYSTWKNFKTQRMINNPLFSWMKVFSAEMENEYSQYVNSNKQQVKQSSKSQATRTVQNHKNQFNELKRTIQSGDSEAKSSIAPIETAQSNLLKTEVNKIYSEMQRFVYLHADSRAEKSDSKRYHQGVAYLDHKPVCWSSGLTDAAADILCRMAGFNQAAASERADVLVGDYAFETSTCTGKSSLRQCLGDSGMKTNTCSGNDKGVKLTCR